MSANVKGMLSNQNQSDLMLWLAAAVIGGIGLTWLLISRPWSSNVTVELPPVGITAPAADADSAIAATDPASPAGQDSSLDSPLRMAQLAYDAGMLIEPIPRLWHSSRTARPRATDSSASPTIC
jgi:hypothetical protein